MTVIYEPKVNYHNKNDIRTIEINLLVGYIAKCPHGLVLQMLNSATHSDCSIRVSHSLVLPSGSATVLSMNQYYCYTALTSCLQLSVSVYRYIATSLYIQAYLKSMPKLSSFEKECGLQIFQG